MAPTLKSHLPRDGILPRVRRAKTDPFTAGVRSYRAGEPVDPEFGLKCKGWGTTTAQCLYEAGRLKAAETSAGVLVSKKRSDKN